MDHAVVIGASMSGLLSAAALHRRFARVTVLDRDTLPDADAHRKGVGQSRH
ncbi:NAD(P)-binding protein, partial [Nonomuraea fuscirosea]